VTEPRQLTFATIGGQHVEVTPRGKHYVEPRGYAAPPGTGPKGETCGLCQHLILKRMAKHYPKCGGRATDVLVRSPACSKWERRK
jgi:hypothetical protein